MTWLNYHHLLYFWTVATEGTIVKASEVLRLAPSTISVQIKELEEALDDQRVHGLAHCHPGHAEVLDQLALGRRR
ncbi:LysR family transcriptional regulator [uncultured Nocardioides sp.]|uniref:LysR family transcriptional regulator n=1 Tax=uncultured Nocardioides sp. TaxID=198441 RepID=UPI00342ACBC5